MKYFFSILLLLTATGSSLQAQQTPFVQTDGFVNTLHQTQVGQITFMAEDIPLAQYKSSDFLSSFTLKKNSNLNIRVFMDNSITNYLHVLAPNLSAEELTTNGNYQFTFWVDNTLIYTENLHPGAGLNKNTTTTFRVPLISTHGEDYWSLYLWNRFLLNGGDHALSIGTHTLKIEIKPYLKLPTGVVKVGDLIARGQLQLKREIIKVSPAQIAIQPIQAKSGWPLAKTPFQTAKIKSLNTKIAQDVFREITSIVVIKNGKLALEEYFNGAKRSTLHDTRSLTKSFTSTLMGIAIKDGYIKDAQQNLKQFYDLKTFANYSPEKEKIKLEDLLKMSSTFEGSDINGDSPGNEENMYPTANWVKFTLDLPIDPHKQASKQWDYFTAGVVLLGDILQKRVPNGLEKYAATELFQPLGISTYQWQYTPQQVVNTAGSLQMRSLDYAKFGQLYQNGGSWNGKQIIPKTWVKASLTKYLPIPERPNEYYGYLFWNKTYTVAGKKYEAFYGVGNGGSKVFIFKDVPLTIVVTAKAFNKAYGHAQVDEILQDYLLPAFTN